MAGFSAGGDGQARKPDDDEHRTSRLREQVGGIGHPQAKPGGKEQTHLGAGKEGRDPGGYADTGREHSGPVSPAPGTAAAAHAAPVEREALMFKGSTISAVATPDWQELREEMIRTQLQK